MTNKVLKKKREEASTWVTLRLSRTESAVLEKMMEKEDWSNRSGFIKEKIFGESADYQYKKMLDSGEKRDIEILLIGLITEMNKRIDYVNFRFDYEMKEFIKKTKKLDEISIKKWLAHVLEWKNGLQEKTNEIFYDCQSILKAININVERKEYGDLEMIPDYMLEDVDWTDIGSPLMQEKARRLYEEFYKNNPDIAATRPEYLKQAQRKNKNK